MARIEAAVESSAPPATGATHRLAAAYRSVRRATEGLCEPLVTEDYVVQSMPDVSPTKWHLAHTSWFFETFLLAPHLAGYEPFDPHFAYLFNSYYVAVGDRHCRQNRGLLSRPTVAQVYAYRAHVDAGMERLLSGSDESRAEALRPLLDLGLNHEQQHQELMLTDVKHVFWVNPLRPAYRPAPPRERAAAPPMRWVRFEGGVRRIGLDPAPGEFSFDNESPRHGVYLEPFEVGSRLVTNGEYKAFMADGGYDRADLWLSMGFATVRQETWRAPLYWIEQEEAGGAKRWLNHTLQGLRPVEDDEPVCHVSFFEADAFARWAGARLATEAEWEVASESVPAVGNFVESCRFHPAPARDETSVETSRERERAVAPLSDCPLPDGRGSSAPAGPGSDAGPVPQQMFGDVWEWTGSAYLGYPGYRPPPGALGEYNGKFMCNQFVLRGGSCATPRSHVRRTYRNFFAPDARWQFSGIRLARSAGPSTAAGGRSQGVERA